MKAVLRVPCQTSEFQSAVLFGGGGNSFRLTSKYHIWPFHHDWHLTKTLSTEFVEAIREAYCDNLTLAEALPPDHPMIHLVSFGFENPPRVGTRSDLYPRLTEPKRLWTLPRIGHYLDSELAHGIVFGDTRATRACQCLLRAVDQDRMTSMFLLPKRRPTATIRSTAILT